MQSTSLIVNGSTVSVTADGDTPLLDILRNHLGLFGTKFGCGQEQCGCCMVLVEGRPEKSCGKTLSTVAGKAITTIEGLGAFDGAQDADVAAAAADVVIERMGDLGA